MSIVQKTSSPSNNFHDLVKKVKEYDEFENLSISDKSKVDTVTRPLVRLYRVVDGFYYLEGEGQLISINYDGKMEVYRVTTIKKRMGEFEGKDVYREYETTGVVLVEGRREERTIYGYTTRRYS